MRSKPMRKCRKCGKEIKPTDKKFMAASDRPYRNIWYHMECWEEIKRENEK